MASLIPNFNYTPNTSAASNAYISAMKSFNDSLMEPVNFLNKLNTDALTQKEREEEKAIRAEDRAWKVEDRERGAKERQASDLFNQELLKGKQIHGGILNTDKAIAEADKFAFTPEELVKYDTYKGDEAAARKAGDTALADKIAWQNTTSDYASSGNSKLKESNVQMMERILGGVTAEGLPVPAELVSGMQKARLDEETVVRDKIKSIDEKRKTAIESLNKDKKWAIGSFGNSQLTDEYGVTHNIGGSTRSSSSEVKANNTNVGQGNKILMTAIDGLKLSDKDAKLDATAKALEVTNILKEQGIPFDDAAAIVANGMYSKEQNPIISYIGLGRKGAVLEQDSIDMFATNALKNYQQTASNTGDKVAGISDRARAATDYYNTQAGNVSRQLAELDKERSLLEGTAEDRQVAALNRELQRRGILEAPAESEISLAKELASKVKADNEGKNLNAPDPTAVVKPVVNKNIKSIAGIPDSLVAAERIVNKAYSLPGEGFTVGMGYNIDKNIKTLATDFEHADIPAWKAELAKTNPENLVLTDGESTRLVQVAYFSRIDTLDRIIGGKFDKLSPEMQGTAMQMMYRGDLGDTAHGKVFKKLIAADDYEGLTGYITANAKNLPAPVVTRFNLDLGMPNKEKLRGDSFMKSGDEKSAYLKKALDGQDKYKGGDFLSKGSVLSTVEKEVETEAGTPLSSILKTQIDELNSAKYADITDVPVAELQSLNKQYTEALKKEKEAKVEKRKKDLLGFNWGRKPIGNGEIGYNLSEEEKKLRAIKENPNAATEDIGLVDSSLDFVGGKVVTKVAPIVKKSINRNTVDDLLNVDPKILRDIFGKYSPNVQGVNRAAGVTRNEILAEMTKLRELKNPSKYDLQELQRLNEMLGKIRKSPSTKAAF